MTSSLRTLLVACWLIAWSASGQAQVDAGALFREANASFRSGLYNTALKLYREAAAAGLDTPSLHYNIGVTSYKLGNYEAAEVAFSHAQASPELAAIAAYNLGLTYRRLGRRAAAAEHFRAAAGASRNRALAELAERAATSVAAAPARPARTAASGNFRDPAAREMREPPGKLRLLMSARLGQDDNVYRTPSTPYVDLAAPGQPLVTPTVQSASFLPVDILAEYTMQNEARDTVFLFGYRLDGDFYDSEFSNANRVSQRLQIGANVGDVGAASRRRRLDSAFYVITHDETNFDPDDGLDRDFNGVDISDRLAYRGAGVETEFEQRLSRWRYGFDLRFEGRQYENAPLIRSYDHNLSFLRLRTAYALRNDIALELGLLKYRRVYDERLARDLNGDLLISNDPLEYDYLGLEIGATYRISRAFEIELDYLRLDRRDVFVGYFDSTQDRLRLKLGFRPNSRLRLSVAADSRVYDYPNAFAFNDAAAGPRDLDHVGIDLRAEFQVTPRLSVWAQLMSEDITSTDTRLAYARTRSMLGMLWRH